MICRWSNYHHANRALTLREEHQTRVLVLFCTCGIILYIRAHVELAKS